MLPSAGATPALFEAAGAASATDCVREWKAAEVKGTCRESGGEAQEDPSNERPGGLQQGHQQQSVYVNFKIRTRLHYCY